MFYDTRRVLLVIILAAVSAIFMNRSEPFGDETFVQFVLNLFAVLFFSWIGERLDRTEISEPKYINQELWQELFKRRERNHKCYVWIKNTLQVISLACVVLFYVSDLLIDYLGDQEIYFVYRKSNKTKTTHTVNFSYSQLQSILGNVNLGCLACLLVWKLMGNCLFPTKEVIIIRSIEDEDEDYIPEEDEEEDQEDDAKLYNAYVDEEDVAPDMWRKTLGDAIDKLREQNERIEKAFSELAANKEITVEN